MTRAGLIFLLSCLPGLVIADTRPKEVSSPKPLAMIADRYHALSNTEETDRKLKFPVIDNDVLVYLIDETKTGKYWYTAHKLDEFLARKDWFGVPHRTTDKLHGEEVDEWDGTDQKNRPRAFFPGPSVLRIDPENGQTIDWLDPDRGASAEFSKFNRPLRDLLSPKNGQPPVFVDDVGVHRGDSGIFFRCGEATGYGEAGDNRVVAYYDANLTPLVAILARDISDKTNCSNITSRVPGISPTLSPSGNYLAVASARKNDETRDIRVFFIGSSRDTTEVYLEKSVDIYDIKTDVFKFPNSMAWFGTDKNQTLHFRRTGQRESLLIRRIQCSEKKCRKIGDLKIPHCLSYGNQALFFPNGKIRNHDRELESLDIFRNIIIKPLTECGALDTATSNTIVVDKVSWFDVAKVNGQAIMAIQAIVKINPSKTGQWSSRILVFKIPNES